MIPELVEVIAAVEELISAGESLQRSVRTQRKLIIAWNSEALLKEIEIHECLLQTVAKLQSRCRTILKTLSVHEPPASLNQLIALLPAESLERQRLSDLQRRSHELFTRLVGDEQRLQAFKDNLLAHLRNAFDQVVENSESVYRETGSKSVPRIPLGLIHQKA